MPDKARAVIYARYSSEAQNEQSIEGQTAECRAYADAHDMTVVGEYIDRAKTGRNDDREAFQRMIRESALGAFSVVLVWKLDRFSRNLYQSFLYEDRLEQNGVKLVSIMEPIADGAAGTITKGIFRVMAQYYSEDLQEKVTRGMRLTAEKGKSTGGTIPLGYRVTKEGNFEVIPSEAAIVREVFERYASGVSLLHIAEDFNARGLRTRRGKLFCKGSFNTLLRNPKYVGTYHYNNEIEIENCVPPIVTREVWDAVQLRFEQSAGKGGRAKAKVDYLLTGKIYCGKCGHLMGGESTRKGETQYNYYACSQKKKKRACDKKNVPKAEIEDAVINSIVELLTDDFIVSIAKAAAQEVEAASGQKDVLEDLKRQQKASQKKVDNIIKAISSGVISEALTSELRGQEETVRSINATIALTEAMQKAILDVDAVAEFLYRFKGGDTTEPRFRKDLCDIFVRKVVVYDDHYDIYYNYTDEKQPNPLAVDVSNSDGAGAPGTAILRASVRSLFCFSRTFLLGNG